MRLNAVVNVLLIGINAKFFVFALNLQRVEARRCEEELSFR